MRLRARLVLLRNALRALPLRKTPRLVSLIVDRTRGRGRRCSSAIVTFAKAAAFAAAAAAAAEAAAEAVAVIVIILTII